MTQRPPIVTKPPVARVLVVGLRREGTSEVIAALRSIATPGWLEQSPPRVWTSPPTPDEQRAAMIDPGASASVAPAIQLESTKRSFLLFECVDGPSSLGLCAAVRFDAVLWVRSADEDTELDTALPTLELARFLGALPAIVFVTDSERASRERRDRVEREAREALSLAGFASDEAPVICSTGAIEAASDAWRAGVAALREALDQRVPYVEEDTFVAVEVRDVFDIRGRGTVIVGAVVAGNPRTTEPLELLSPRGRIATTIVGIDIFRRPTPMEVPRSAGLVGLQIQLPRDRVSPGDYLVTPQHGAVATRAIIEGFCWQNATDPSLADPLRCVTSAAARTARVVSSDPSPLSIGAFTAELRFDVPTPLVHGCPLNLRREGDPPFATITVVRTLD
ncbi:MAG: hypothetical protein JNK05_21625 [Myxococcales bacterium]|nr:hypothetical protein [Myxococcales bacterium]